MATIARKLLLQSIECWLAFLENLLSFVVTIISHQFANDREKETFPYIFHWISKKKQIEMNIFFKYSLLFDDHNFSFYLYTFLF